ncbi:MAG: hypothetical protein KA984_00555 [Candidatus Cloacimonetes bacterium]|nr:hypothetical protein [Candidatus Cloacimonadota bacterium]
MHKSLVLIMLLCLAGVAVNAQQAALPITSYDYALPENYVSPIGMGTGAFNLTNGDDPFAAYSNPALLADNEISSFSTSFRLKNEDDISFWEAASIGNTLRGKQFKYFVLNSKMVSFGYQPVASVNISEITGASSKYYDYKLDKLQFSIGGKDKKYNRLGAGLSAKYLSGRLVYLAEHIVGDNMVRDAFIDDKVKGFSTDLAFTYDAGDITYAACAYDLFSRLYWENYDSESITRRMAIGMGYDKNNSHFNAGIQNRIAKDAETSYHLGYGYQWDMGSSTQRQTMDLRLGTYSHDFYGADNINFTLGGGYYYKNFRFDFSLNSIGMKLADSEYLFALSLGI